MDGPNSIHNVPPQLDLPAHGKWQKQSKKRRPTPAASDDADATAQESPSDSGAAQDGTAGPENREIGTQIDIEA